MQALITAGRLWLESNIHPVAPGAVLALIVWAALWLVRKYAPNAWESVAKLGPTDRRASVVFQALPAVLMQGAIAAYVAGGDVWEATKLAAWAFLAPLWHHLLKALPIVPYVGGSFPAASTAIPQPPKPPSPPGPPAFLCFVVVLHLSLVGCSVFSSPEVKNVVRTADDAARALCAIFHAERQGISVTEAFDAVCKTREVWEPFYRPVLQAQKAGRSGASPDAAMGGGQCTFGYDIAEPTDGGTDAR